MIKRFINYLALLFVMVVCYNSAFAVPQATFSVGNRWVENGVYYADINVTVPPGEVLEFGATLYFHFNSEALETGDYGFLDDMVENPQDPELFSIMNVNSLIMAMADRYPNRYQRIVVDMPNKLKWYLEPSANLTFPQFTGTQRVGTLRLAVVDPTKMDSLQIVNGIFYDEENVFLTRVWDAKVYDPIEDGMIANLLTYNCSESNCYQINNPEPMILVPVQNTIATTIVETELCANSEFDVAFTANGTYSEGNVFTAQISDEDGSFAAPTTIGTFTGITSGTIEATLPEGLVAGADYRVRVVSSNPVVTGADNGADLTINALPVDLILIGDEFCAEDGGEISLIEAEQGVSYQLFKDGVAYGDEVVNQSIDDITWSELPAGTYTVVAMNVNGCVVEMATERTLAPFTLPTEFALEAVAGTTYCDGSNGVQIRLAGSEEDVTYRLQKNGNNFSDAMNGNGSVLIWSNVPEGTYTVSAVYGTGCTTEFETSLVITKTALPAVYALNPSATSYCADADGVTITLAGSELGVTYQLKNGNTNVGTPKVGTGNAITWDNVLAGTFTVFAHNTTTTCERNITATPVAISVTALPIVNISGATQVAQNNTVVYSTEEVADATYLWEVEGGTINGSDADYTVSVTWGAAGTGALSVTKTVNGCTNEDAVEVAITDYIVPSIQAKYIIFSGVTQTQMNVRWSRGNGNKVLVVAYPADAEITAPTMTSEYDVDELIGEGVVVYVGTGKQALVTGLTAGETYTFKAYEYFDGGIYTLVDAVYNPRSKNTVPGAPVLNAEVVTPHTADLSWTYNGSLSYFEFELAEDANFTEIVDGWQATDLGNLTELTVEDLDMMTTYHYRVRAVSGFSVSPWIAGTFTTPQGEPTVLPSNIQFANVTHNSMNVSWTAGDGESYLVVVKTNTDTLSAPVDGTVYAVGDNYGSAKVVYNGTATNFLATGLTSNKMNHFVIYTYNGAAANVNYNAQGVTAGKNTLAIAPTEAPTDLVFSDVSETSMNIAWTASATATRYIVLGVNEADEDKEFGTLLSATEYEADDLVGDAKVLYVGGDVEFDLYGLEANNVYTIKVYGMNGANPTVNYLNIPLTGTQATMPAAPTTAPTNFVFSSVAPTTATVAFTKGNGASTVVFMNTVNEFTAPTAGTEYEVGEDNVVYVGDAATFNLTALTANTKYYFAAYSFNGIEELTNYNTTALNGNFTTLSTQPTSAPTALEANNATVSTIDLSWTNSAKSILLINDANDFTAPTDGEEYLEGEEIGTAEVLAVGDLTELTISELTANTTYYFAVYSFNGENGTQNYYATPATISEATLPTEPTAVTELTVEAISNVSVDLSWTKGNGTNTIILASTSAITAVPVDAANYSVNDMLSGAEVVYMGTDAATTISGLTANTKYYFAAFAYNGAGTKTNFNTIAAEAEATTLEFAPATKLAVIAPNTLTNGTPFNVTVESQTTGGVATPSTVARLITLTQVDDNGSLFGTLTATIPAGSSSVTFNGLVFYANNGASQLVLNAATTGLTAGTANIAIPVAAPTQQDKLILFSNVTNLGMTVKWTAGNGSHRILVMKAGSAPTAAPVNGTVYSVDAANTTLSDGSFVKHVGTTTTANITGLDAGTTYHFKAFNYNTPANPVYCTAPGSFNPRSRATVAKGEVAPQDELTEADINDNSFFVGNINPNPVVNNINFNMTNHAEMVMNISVFDASGREVAKLANGELINIGTRNFNYSLSNDLSSGTYLLVVTAGDQTAVQTFSIVK